MRRALALLIAGAVLSGIAAYAATAQIRTDPARAGAAAAN
jgi:hypothetical protein